MLGEVVVASATASSPSPISFSSCTHAISLTSMFQPVYLPLKVRFDLPLTLRIHPDRMQIPDSLTDGNRLTSLFIKVRRGRTSDTERRKLLYLADARRANQEKNEMKTLALAGQTKSKSTRRSAAVFTFTFTFFRRPPGQQQQE